MNFLYHLKSRLFKKNYSYSIISDTEERFQLKMNSIDFCKRNPEKSALLIKKLIDLDINLACSYISFLPKEITPDILQFLNPSEKKQIVRSILRVETFNNEILDTALLEFKKFKQSNV